MGRDNHNAGIHMRPKNYKTPCDSIGKWDKYAAILGSAKIIKKVGKPYGESTILQRIVEKNQVTFWERKGQAKVCNCGGKLEYSDRNTLIWLEGQCEKQVQITGKYCVVCGRKYVVRKDLLSAIKNN